MAGPQLSDSSAQGLSSMLSGGFSMPELKGMATQEYAKSRELGDKIEKTADSMGSVIDSRKGMEPPAAPKAAPEPKEQESDPWQAFGSAAGFLATAGSLLTRRPLTNALNAAGGVMKAQQEGNHEEYKRQLELMKYHNEEAFKLADFELSHYKAVLDNDKLTEDVKKAQIDAYAHAQKNDAMIMLGQNRPIGEMYKYVNDQEKQIETMRKNSFKIQEDAAKQELMQEIVQTPDYINASPQEKMAMRVNAAKGGGASTFTEDALQGKAEQYLAGDKSVMQGLGRGVQGSANIIALQNKIYQEAKEQGMSGEDIATKMAEFEGLKAEMRTLGQREANLDTFVYEARNMGDLLREASTSFPRSNFVPLAEGEIGLAKNVSDPKAAQYVQAFNSFVNASARTINAGKGGTVSDKEHIRDGLLSSWGDKALNAAIDQWNKDFSVILTAPAQARKKIINEIRGDKGLKGISSEEEYGIQKTGAESKEITDKSGKKITAYKHRDGGWYDAPEE